METNVMNQVSTKALLTYSRQKRRNEKVNTPSGDRAEVNKSGQGAEKE